MSIVNPPTPQHTHDCEHCILLANLGDTDIYVCGETGIEDEEDSSLLSRRSSEAADYSSIPVRLARSIAKQDVNWDLRVRLFDAFLAGRNSL